MYPILVVIRDPTLTVASAPSLQADTATQDMGPRLTHRAAVNLGKASGSGI